MTDWLLGLIALGTLTTALLQVIVIVSILRIGRRVMTRVERLKATCAPLPVHVAEVAANLARVQALAESRMQRLSSLYAMVESPVRQGFATIAIARGVSQLFRRVSRPARSRPNPKPTRHRNDS